MNTIYPAYSGRNNQSKFTLTKRFPIPFKNPILDKGNNSISKLTYVHQSRTQMNNLTEKSVSLSINNNANKLSFNQTKNLLLKKSSPPKTQYISINASHNLFSDWNKRIISRPKSKNNLGTNENSRNNKSEKNSATENYLMNRTNKNNFNFTQNKNQSSSAEKDITLNSNKQKKVNSNSNITSTIKGNTNNTKSYFPMNQKQKLITRPIKKTEINLNTEFDYLTKGNGIYKNKESFKKDSYNFKYTPVQTISNVSVGGSINVKDNIKGKTLTTFKTCSNCNKPSLIKANVPPEEKKKSKGRMEKSKDKNPLKGNLKSKVNVNKNKKSNYDNLLIEFNKPLVKQSKTIEKNYDSIKIFPKPIRYNTEENEERNFTLNNKTSNYKNFKNLSIKASQISKHNTKPNLNKNTKTEVPIYPYSTVLTQPNERQKYSKNININNDRIQSQSQFIKGDKIKLDNHSDNNLEYKKENPINLKKNPLLNTLEVDNTKYLNKKQNDYILSRNQTIEAPHNTKKEYWLEEDEDNLEEKEKEAIKDNSLEELEQNFIKNKKLLQKYGIESLEELEYLNQLYNQENNQIDKEINEDIPKQNPKLGESEDLIMSNSDSEENDEDSSGALTYDQVKDIIINFSEEIRFIYAKNYLFSKNDYDTFIKNKKDILSQFFFNNESLKEDNKLSLNIKKTVNSKKSNGGVFEENGAEREALREIHENKSPSTINSSQNKTNHAKVIIV